MMRPVSAFVGLRYLRTQRSNHFASFVTVTSVLGVALGVAALIVVLSVMNGFENELRTRLLGMTGHATVMLPAGGPPWSEWVDDISEFEGISATAPFVELEGVLSSGRELSGAVIYGVMPRYEERVSRIGSQMHSGSLGELRSGSRSIVLGRALARRLGVVPGDRLSVMVPARVAGRGLTTRLRQFRVSGVFELGLRDYDGVRALVHLDDAVSLSSQNGPAMGLRVRTDDVFAAPGRIRQWAASWEARGRPVPSIRDWTQQNATYFRAVRIEKIMMTLLLSLIVGVAAFNIVATLVMTVTDKRGGIAILRTLGFPRRLIVAVFVLQGTVIGWAGVIIGVALGVSLAVNVDTFAPRLEQAFGFEFMPADVYYLTSLPADLHSADVFWVGAIALLMTALATVYPALRAAAVAPAEVLRYE